MPFSRCIHELLPDSTFLVLAGAGRLPALGQPARVNAAIGEFPAAHGEFAGADQAS